MDLGFHAGVRIWRVLTACRMQESCGLGLPEVLTVAHMMIVATTRRFAQNLLCSRNLHFYILVSGPSEGLQSGGLTAARTVGLM